MKLSFKTLDVFTRSPYVGNPLGVIEIPPEYSGTLTQEQKQLIAREFNLSESVFIHQAPEDADTIRIDIFTTQAELPFAGHPTIGAAFYLTHYLSNTTVKTLLTRAGPIAISYDKAAGRVSAKISHNVHVHKATIPYHSSVGGESPIVSIVKGMSFVLVQLPSLETLAAFNSSVHEDSYDPKILDTDWATGLIGSSGYVLLEKMGNVQKVRTRMHAEDFEDPATGSAAGAMSCYLALAEPVEKGSGPFVYEITQGVEMGRKSDIRVEVARSEDGKSIKEVTLGGSAVMIMEGSLEVPQVL
jgi:PhzF family phenazine biosynthesis protein